MAIRKQVGLHYSPKTTSPHWAPRTYKKKYPRICRFKGQSAKVGLSHEHSWDGNNYSVQDSQGSRGTISFQNDLLVGVFFHLPSARGSTPAEMMPERVLLGCGKAIEVLARKEALLYLLEEFQGKSIPQLTTAFWGGGKTECLLSKDAWPAVYKKGAFLVSKECLPTEEALPLWANEYEFTEAQVSLVTNLFERRMTTKPPFKLRSSEDKSLKSYCVGVNGWEAASQSLTEIGFQA